MPVLDFIDTLPHKFQFVIATLLIIVTLALVSLLAAEIQSNQPHKAAGNSAAVSTSLVSWNGDSPNMVANGLGVAINTFERATNAAGLAVTNGTRTVGMAITSSARDIMQGPKIILHGVGSGLLWTARTVGSGLFFAGRMVGSSLLFILNIPVNIASYAFETPVVSAMIRPGSDGKIPTIDANDASMFTPATLASNTKSSHQVATKTSAVCWPIHGAITTLFGVPEWPYEPIHTGIDISDGAAPGVTQVHAFKAGKVIDVIHSNLGLGNHVIIDHGNGMTSVYGHLNSISVRVGQQVDMNTVVGYEGTTGVSTGTHLHFEIRLDGVAVNPQKFITGQP